MHCQRFSILLLVWLLFWYFSPNPFAKSIEVSYFKFELHHKSTSCGLLWTSSLINFLQAEAAIASKILSGTCSFNMLKVKIFCLFIKAVFWTTTICTWTSFGFYFQKLAHCLALLPKSRGDEGSWSLMMQKILIWINNHLNDAFQGFEGSHYSALLFFCWSKDHKWPYFFFFPLLFQKLNVMMKP